MHWRKITAYTLILIVLSVIPTTITTYVWGIPELYSVLRVLGEHAAIAMISFIVFMFLGRNSLPNPYVHSLLVLVLSSVVSFVTLSLLMGEFRLEAFSVLGSAFSLVAMVLGTYVGLIQDQRKCEAVT